MTRIAATRRRAAGRPEDCTHPGGNAAALTACAPVRALLLAGGVLLASSGCACLNRANTPLVNAVEKHLVPSHPAAKVVAAPAVVPVGVAAGLADVFVVHPVSVLPKAADDTRHALWEHWSEPYVTRMGTVPYRAVLTPIVFVGAELGRSLFDIPSSVRGPPSRAASDDRAARLTPGDLRRMLEAGEWQGVREWTEWAARSGSDPSAGLRVILESAPATGPESRLGEWALGCLLGPWFAQNSDYLLEFFASGKAGSRADRIVQAMVHRRYAPLSRHLLRRLAEPGLPSAQMRTYVDAIFRLDVKADVEAMTSALQKGLAAPSARP